MAIKLDRQQAIREMVAAAEAAQGSAPVAVDIQPGEMFCQGDIGIIRLAKLPSTWTKRERPTDGQVAPGTGAGSQHCVTGEHQWYRFSGDRLSDIGLVAEVAWTMTHPRHGHVTCPPGVYQFVQQQNESGRRVLE